MRETFLVNYYSSIGTRYTFYKGNFTPKNIYSPNIIIAYCNITFHEFEKQLVLFIAFIVGQ